MAEKRQAFAPRGCLDHAVVLHAEGRAEQPADRRLVIDDEDGGGGGGHAGSSSVTEGSRGGRGPTEHRSRGKRLFISELRSLDWLSPRPDVVLPPRKPGQQEKTGWLNPAVRRYWSAILGHKAWPMSSACRGRRSTGPTPSPPLCARRSTSPVPSSSRFPSTITASSGSRFAPTRSSEQRGGH